jgi:hypothetical protein
VGFEDLLASEFVGVKDHPVRADQKILLFKISGYIWLVPCVEEYDYLFLKTLYPSRKYTKLHREGFENEKD